MTWNNDVERRRRKRFQRDHVRSHGEHGQMVVELCVVMPVILMVAVAIIDGLSFTAVSSRFDHLAAQAVLATSSPAGTDFSAEAAAGEVQAQLESEVDNENASISVSASQNGKLCSFECKVSVTPWPLSAGGASVFGMRVPGQLEHSLSFCIRPYEIGGL